MSHFSSTELAGGVIAAYVSHNPVPASALPALIARVHGAIAGLTSGANTLAADTAVRETVDKPNPAQIRKSVQHNEIVSFLDGKTYKTLKRHLTANDEPAELS